MQFHHKSSLTSQEISSIAQLCQKNENYDAFYETGNFPFPCFFLALNQGELVGFLSILPWEEQGEITAVTDEAFRRQGIFARLLSLAHETNPARSLTGSFWGGFDLSNSSLCRGLSHSEYFMTLAGPCRNLWPAAAEQSHDLTVTAKKETYFLCKAGKQIGVAHLEEEGRFTNLWGVEIKEPYRRMGYGSKLISFVVKDYFSSRQKPLLLHVKSSNTGACRLYEKLGFSLAQKIDYYYF